LSKFFTNLARQNGNKFADLEEEFNHNIWHLYTPEVTPDVEEIRFYFK